MGRIAELNSLGQSDHPWARRSLADLLSLTDYRTLRPELTEKMLLGWLRGRPEIVEQWIAWSEDKRTSGGYYLEGMPNGRWRIGRVSATPVRTYETKTAAVAAYILRELDYWVAPSGERS